jgi:hypothetical protein
VKTRGEGHVEENVVIEQLETAPIVLASRIIVPKKAYTTFRCMYPQKDEERQREVAWDTFVSNMGEAGFSARNSGGSIVTFESERAEGKINFHKPHPDPVIDPIMLRTMGRRLNKWFGWTRETFVLASK